MLLLQQNGWSATPIRVEGNRAFSDKEIAAFVGSDAAAVTDSLSALRVQDSLVARDFLCARVSARRGRELTLHVTEGSLARIRDVAWRGDSTQVPAQIYSRTLTRRGAIFRWDNLAADLAQILDALSNVGYPFAKVELERVTAIPESAFVDVQVRISCGAFTQLEFVDYPGAAQTIPEVLNRVARLQLPAPFDEQQLKRARERLRQLEFLEGVAPMNVVLAPDGRSGVSYAVSEARATRLDVVAGLIPKGSGSGSELAGLVHLDFLNLFGTGRKGRIYWDRPNARIQQIELFYREPWVLGTGAALSGTFSQRVEDTLYIARAVGAGIDFEVGLGFRAEALIRAEDILVDSATSEALGLPENRTLYAETSLSFDSRDFPANPRQGVFLSTFGGSGQRTRGVLTTQAGGDYQIRRAGFDTEFAVEFAPLCVADAQTHARVFSSDEPDVLRSDLYKVGGARTVRGYREEQFAGDRVGWLALEARYLLGEKSRAFAFADAGAIHRPTGTATTTYISSAGVGMRMETRLGIAGFDYGVGDGDPILSGKVHVSLTSQF
jgi:outer membrane protein insertion porin family